MKKLKMNLLSLVVIMILVVLMAVPVMAAPTPSQATLNIITHVINDDGSPALAANFGIHVMSSGVEVVSSPTVGEEAPGTIYTLPVGTYSINESNHSGYDVSYSGDSDANGNITLTSGANKTVTITNNDNLISTQSNKPLIDVIKSTEPTSLGIGGGSVTYTYTVTNVGRVSISNISVIDDEINSVIYESGDINDDKLLQVNEVWVYTGKTVLRSSLTNTVIARGNANGMMAADTALGSVVVAQPVVIAPPTVITPPAVVAPPTVVTPPVVVTPPAVIAPPTVVTETVTGGDLPATATPLFGVLLLGGSLTLVGAAGWKKR